MFLETTITTSKWQELKKKGRPSPNLANRLNFHILKSEGIIKLVTGSYGVHDHYHYLLTKSHPYPHTSLNFYPSPFNVTFPPLFPPLPQHLIPPSLEAFHSPLMIIFPHLTPPRPVLLSTF